MSFRSRASSLITKSKTSVFRLSWLLISDRLGARTAEMGPQAAGDALGCGFKVFLCAKVPPEIRIRQPVPNDVSISRFSASRVSPVSTISPRSSRPANPRRLILKRSCCSGGESCNAFSHARHFAFRRLGSGYTSSTWPPPMVVAGKPALNTKRVNTRGRHPN